jgi:hypothetical protein
MVVFSMVASGSEDHTAWTSRPTDFRFSVPGSAFAALTAAGLPTNLPLAGQSIQVRWWHAPCGCGV